MEVPPSPRPPSPNQAGGSGWQNQQQQEPTYEYWQRAGFGMEQQFPMPNFGWRPRMDEPEGEGHMSTGSGSRSFWSSAHDQDETQQSYQDWMSSQQQTPPPDPTQVRPARAGVHASSPTSPATCSYVLAVTFSGSTATEARWREGPWSVR
nr:uncharacterized protein LOC127313283 [Lolium perenne]